MKRMLNHLAFVLLSSLIMVFFSEKTFWYIQGYATLELVLFYALPTAVCIGVIELFQVQRLSGLVLVGGLFGFLVEGILTPVIYEAGLLDPVLPAYFVGWHGMLSVVLGWYFIHKCLVERRWKRLLLTSSLFGIFWGLWSLAYRLPESIQEFQALAEAGEQVLPGAWPVADYGLYTLVFTSLLAAAHWLLGRGFWQKSFSLNKYEAGALAAILILFYLTLVFPVIPFGFLKLGGLIALVVIPLRLVQMQSTGPSVLSLLDSPVDADQLAPLLCIPLAATLVYALAEVFQPPNDWLRALYVSIYSLQAVAGGLFFLWAWVDSIRIWRAGIRK